MIKNLAKYATDLFYLIGGPLIHVYMMTQQRELYAAVDDTAWSVYQTLWTNVVLPNLTPLVILLVLLEMGAGALMLSKDPAPARIGQTGGLIFNLLLVPFWFFYGIPNLLLVALHFWLMQQGQSVPNRILRPVF
jgi:hypothetical protein